MIVVGVFLLVLCMYVCMSVRPSVCVSVTRCLTFLFRLHCTNTSFLTTMPFSFEQSALQIFLTESSIPILRLNSQVSSSSLFVCFNRERTGTDLWNQSKNHLSFKGVKAFCKPLYIYDVIMQMVLVYPKC